MQEEKQQSIPDDSGIEWPGAIEQHRHPVTAEIEWPGGVGRSRAPEAMVWESLPVGETRNKRPLGAVEAVKIALMYHHKRRHETLEGLVGETISNLPPLGAVLSGGFTNPTAYATVTEYFQNLSNPEQALLATILISGTLGWKIRQNRLAEKKIRAILVEYKDLFTGRALPAAERTRRVEAQTARLHKDCRLELEGLPDEIKAKDFKVADFLEPQENAHRDTMDESGKSSVRTYKSVAREIGNRLPGMARQAGQTMSDIVRVFRDTVRDVAYYAHPTKGFGPLVKDVFQNGVNVANLYSNSGEYTKHALHYLKHFRDKDQGADSPASEACKVENAKGLAVIVTAWTECTVLLQSFFIYQEGRQGAGHLSSAFSNYSMGNAAQARSDLLMGAVELFISAGFATKALQELLREFSHNHDQLESNRSKKLNNTALELLEAEDAYRASSEKTDILHQRVQVLRARIENPQKDPKKNNGYTL